MIDDVTPSFPLTLLAAAHIVRPPKHQTVGLKYLESWKSDDGRLLPVAEGVVAIVVGYNWTDRFLG